MNHLEEKPEANGPRTHIYVSVHGIGNQQRNATVRSVANRLASSEVLFKRDAQPFHPQPLGYFHSPSGEVRAFPVGKDKQGNKVMVAEVFWADIPQDVVAEGRTLEETKAWAHTVVGRARKACYVTKQPDTKPKPDFGLAAQVLDEVIDTVRVVEKLAVLGTKVGLPKVDVQTVFEEFLGDVQIVAEFEDVRNQIIGCFHDALEQLSSANPYEKKDFHIVAHSEGTVVSFLGLLHAMSGQTFKTIPETERTADAAKTEGMTGSKSTCQLMKGGRLPDWVKQVKSFMTIGSPIDKHLLLWPKLFEELDLNAAEDHFNSTKEKIRWKNYYDLGDPVGFELDATVAWLEGEAQ